MLGRIFFLHDNFRVWNRNTMAQNKDVSENELEFYNNGVSVDDAMIAQRTRKCVAER